MTLIFDLVCIFLLAAQVELRPAVDLGKSCVKEHGPHGEDHTAMVLDEVVHAGRFQLFARIHSHSIRSGAICPIGHVDVTIQMYPRLKRCHSHPHS